MKTSAYLRPMARSLESIVSVRYTHKHKYFAVRTGLTILPKFFDEDNGTIRRSHPDNIKLNAVIQLKRSAVMNAALDVVLRGLEPTVDLVRDQLNGVVSAPTKQVKLHEPKALPPVLAPDPEPRKKGRPSKADLAAKEAARTLTEPVPTPVLLPTTGTSRRFHELLIMYGNGSVHDAASTKKDKKLFVKVVHEFQAWHDAPMEFAKMDAWFYERLAKYFLDVRGGFNNIFGKRIKELKAFLRWCETEHNVKVHQAYRKWKVYQEEKEIVFLTEEEIDKVWAIKHLNGTMARYRDIFVFACITGFRWSDIIRSKQMVVQNGLLTILTQKNRGNAKVPMTDRIRLILDRYNGDLNVVPLPKLNLAVKELAQMAGLDKPVHYYRHKLREAVVYEEPMWKLLSMHCGRRSFITNSFTKGFSVNEILEMIGSSDAKVLGGYLAITGSHLVQRTKQLSE
ncbi:hypothetical protein [Hymenobacter siberiensis]|uniref:hypothetical protein n=1 Tax=Hymenobacter siberiensis TaxID=2848396 RepID=UPI001C1DECBE|nr:hypothetical protein [Hymenobacter siberiensis]